MTQKARHVRAYVGPIAAFTFVFLIAAASGSCVLGTKTMLCETSLRCPPGWVCSADEKACINLAGCGDGIVAPENGEICDDGNIEPGDGCSTDCRSRETCGNGIVDVIKGESCDQGDNNGKPGNNCSTLCELAACGNGLVDLNEDCDPGQQDSAGCNSNRGADDEQHCKFAHCGDGYINGAAGEHCDNGPMETAGCNSPTFCKVSICGDNFRNIAAGEACDTGGDSAICNGASSDPSVACNLPRCGDGYTNSMFNPTGAAPESCDDGNAEDCGTCISGCSALAQKAKGFLKTPDGMHINEEEAFSLSDGVNTVKFQYKTTAVPAGYQQINIADNADAAAAAAETATRINAQNLLKITATAVGDRVELTADQPGSGKLDIMNLSLNMGFSWGVTVMGTGSGLCSAGKGCKSDEDCDSNNCVDKRCKATP